MSKRPPKKLRRDERRRRSEHRAAIVVTDRDTEAFVATLDREQLALAVLAKHSSGIAKCDFDAATSMVMETAEREDMDPAEVALHLLALRDASPAEREIAMPDPEERTSLAGFFNFPGPSAAPFLAALKELYAEAARFSRLSAPEQEAILRAQEARKRERRGPGVASCAGAFSYTKTHTSTN